MTKEVSVVFSEEVGSVGSVWGGEWNAAVFVLPPGTSGLGGGGLVPTAADGGVVGSETPPSAYSEDVAGGVCVHQ